MNKPKYSSIRVPAIDGLRGLAIFLVLLHMFQIPQPLGASNAFVDTGIATLATAGWVGVQLFFVLSGYLITGQLLDSQDSSNYFSGFFTRRALRIFPLYYGMLILAFVIRPLFLAKPLALNEAAHDQIWLWTFLYNWVHPYGHVVDGFTHFWSLAVEEQFYIFWPFMVWRRSPKQVLFISIVLVAAALIIRIALHAQGFTPLAVYVFTVCRMDALAAGAAVAAIVRLSNPAAGSPGRKNLAIMAGLTSLIVGSALLPYFNQNSLFMQTIGMSLLSIGFATLVLLVWNPAYGPKLLATALASKPLRMLGKYSYGMYVFHLPLSAFGLSHLIPYLPWQQSGFLPVIYFVLATTVTLSLAIVSYHVYEGPILRLKDRIARPHVVTTRNKNDVSASV